MQRVPPFLPKNNNMDGDDQFSLAFSQTVSAHIENQRTEIDLFINSQKQEEIEKAAKRTMELQDFLRRIEIENQTWQRVAKENEAMVGSLNSTIQRLRETAANDAAGDSGSCCLGEEEKNLEQKTRKMMMVCRFCNSRNSCVIMLPCRHLCSCRVCDGFLDSCPVCKMVKKASIEALI
ncbi:hypothetical protein DH2020_006894 [Rehmannia glutinosa]|uniref:RING-type domain-containing protein n=1 Tax=Rehmannia glutinosa TaxID=99300 RepID=A0ABR0XK81_REHGL